MKQLNYVTLVIFAFFNFNFAWSNDADELKKIASDQNIENLKNLGNYCKTLKKCKRDHFFNIKKIKDDILLAKNYLKEKGSSNSSFIASDVINKFKDLGSYNSKVEMGIDNAIYYFGFNYSSIKEAVTLSIYRGWRNSHYSPNRMVTYPKITVNDLSPNANGGFKLNLGSTEYNFNKHEFVVNFYKDKMVLIAERNSHPDTAEDNYDNSIVIPE
ncbi:hypothetical protein N9N67_00275 [Bacteriovoracaceae bacterium]|nr:hypothetical protein [Bacteriovoracaceae bacterium]